MRHVMTPGRGDEWTLDRAKRCELIAKSEGDVEVARYAYAAALAIERAVTGDRPEKGRER